MHPKCLECPRFACRYDSDRSVRRPPPDMAGRDENVRRQRALGASITQLMSEFGLANRTIHRIIAGAPAKADR